MSCLIAKTLPVARFYYQGHHSHPVRRTVLVIESNSQWFRGYELREGSNVRNFGSAPVKTYRRNKVAKIKQCGRLKKRFSENELTLSTLKRKPLLDLITNGV